MNAEDIFAERLKELRDDKNLSITALAKQLKVSRVTVSQISNGAHLPSTEMLIALADYFNCSADYLLGFTDYTEYKSFKKPIPFADVLKKCLKESNLTEYRLQADLKLSRSLTYRWLNGRAVPTVDSLVKLKSYFGVSVDYLLGREN